MAPQQRPPRRPLTPEEIQRRNIMREKRRREHERQMRIRARRRKRFLLLLAAAAVITVVIIIIANSRPDAVEKAKPAEVPEDTAPVTEEPVPETEPVSVVYPSAAPDVQTLEIDSEYGVLVRLSDNNVVADKKGSEKIYPASMTKIMTLAVAVENVPDIEKTTFTYTAEMLQPFYKENASVAGFKAGETVTVKDMLYGLILPSGADAAAGIAQCVSGSEAAFVQKMNETAVRIGMNSTHFANPTGLHDENQYSTCLDIAVLLEYAMKNPICAQVLSTYQYKTAPSEQNPSGIELTSTMFSRLEGGEPGTSRVYAGKTGYTTEAGNCLASYAKSNADGSEYVFVTAKGGSIWKPIFDAINTYKLFIK